MCSLTFKKHAMLVYRKIYKDGMRSLGSLLLIDASLNSLFLLGHFSYSLSNTFWENSKYLNILFKKRSGLPWWRSG